MWRNKKNNNADIYLILDVIRGGELFDRIIEQENFNEEDACSIAAQLVAVSSVVFRCCCLFFVAL